MESVTSTLKELIKSGTSLGGNVFLIMLLLVLGFATFGAWFYWVIKPDRDAAREAKRLAEENKAKLGETVSALSDIALSTRRSVRSIKRQVNQSGDDLRKTLRCKLIEVEAIAKLAKKLDIDISSELGNVKGLIDIVHLPPGNTDA